MHPDDAAVAVSPHAPGPARSALPSNDPPREGIGLRETAIPLALVRGAGMAVEFVAFALIARALGPSGFGSVAVAFVVARYLGMVADWGASLGGSRLLAGPDPDWPAAQRLIRWRAVVGAVLGIAFMGVTGTFAPGLAPIGITVVCRALNRDWISVGLGKGTRAGTSPLVQGIALVAASVVVLERGSTVSASWAIALGYAAGAIASVALNRVPRTAQAIPTGHTGSTERAPWIVLLQVADQVLLSADTLMVALLASQHSAGIYAAVCRIPNAAITGQGLLMTGLVPGVARRIASGDRATIRTLRRASLRIGGTISAVILLASPLALWALPRIFGQGYADGGFALFVLLVSVAISAGTVALMPIALGMGRERQIAIGYVATMAFNLVANVVVISAWSYNGAAVVMLVSQMLLAATYLRTTRQRVG